MHNDMKCGIQFLGHKNYKTMHEHIHEFWKYNKRGSNVDLLRRDVSLKFLQLQANWARSPNYFVALNTFSVFIWVENDTFFTPRELGERRSPPPGLACRKEGALLHSDWTNGNFVGHIKLSDNIKINKADISQ